MLDISDRTNKRQEIHGKAAFLHKRYLDQIKFAMIQTAVYAKNPPYFFLSPPWGVHPLTQRQQSETDTEPLSKRP